MFSVFLLHNWYFSSPHAAQQTLPPLNLGSWILKSLITSRTDFILMVLGFYCTTYFPFLTYIFLSTLILCSEFSCFPNLWTHQIAKFMLCSKTSRRCFCIVTNGLVYILHVLSCFEGGFPGISLHC